MIECTSKTLLAAALLSGRPAAGQVVRRVPITSVAKLPAALLESEDRLARMDARSKFGTMIGCVRPQDLRCEIGEF